MAVTRRLAMVAVAMMRELGALKIRTASLAGTTSCLGSIIGVCAAQIHIIAKVNTDNCQASKHWPRRALEESGSVTSL